MKINTKLLLVAARNLLCWIGDLLLSILPNGRLMTSDLTDINKLRTLLEGTNLNHFSLSAIFGSIAMMVVLCVFNALGIPGGMNLGGLGMFLGLYYCITRYRVLEKK